MTAQAPPLAIAGQTRVDVLFRGGKDHPQRSTCPACQGNLETTALVRLAYVFTPCKCERLAYGHLYEQLWHSGCLRESPDSLAQALETLDADGTVVFLRGSERVDAALTSLEPDDETAWLSPRGFGQLLHDRLAFLEGSEVEVVPTTVIGGTDG